MAEDACTKCVAPPRKYAAQAAAASTEELERLRRELPGQAIEQRTAVLAELRLRLAFSSA